MLGNQLGLEGFEYLSSSEVLEEVEARIAAGGSPTPAPALREPELRHEGGVNEPGMYATDMLLRRSRPLQETHAGRDGGRRWP